MSRNSGAATAPRSRAQLLWILGIALGSLGGAYLLFGMAGGGGLLGTTNRGAFVEPPLTATDLGVREASGKAFSASGIWWLWVVPGGSCDDACRRALHQLRQLHALLNKDAVRVRRAIVTETPIDANVVQDYPRLAVLSGSLRGLATGIYVVDPLGNLVFHYALSDAGEPVLDDLKRLLKVSQIG